MRTHTSVRRWLWGLSVLLVGVVSSGCEPDKRAGGSPDGRTATFAASPTDTYPTLCGYTVTNATGGRIVEANLEHGSDGSIESFEVHNYSDGRRVQSHRYRIVERKPGRIELRVSQEGTESEETYLLLATPIPNVVELKSGPDTSSLATMYHAVYSESPLEVLAAGAAFPLGETLLRETFEFDDSNRLVRADIDRNADGTGEATVDITYEKGRIVRIDLGGDRAMHKYLTAEYEDDRLDLLLVDTDIDGAPEEELVPRYDCSDE
jgi:hypothetical protein